MKRWKEAAEEAEEETEEAEEEAGESGLIEAHTRSRSQTGRTGHTSSNVSSHQRGEGAIFQPSLSWLEAELRLPWRRFALTGNRLNFRWRQGRRAHVGS